MAQRITIETPIQFQDSLPDAADVVIIGGGVIGTFTALYLARVGQKVVLCEKGRIASEQSSRNWGWIRQQGRDVAELPIMMRALELWKEVDAETGGACGIRVCGTTYMSRGEESVETYEDWVRIARDHDLESHHLTGAEVDTHFGPAARGGWTHALHTPSDARGEPWQAVPAVGRLAQAAGALLREDCAVRALDLAGGRVTGVVTEAGTIRCAQVVLAAGAWSSLFARRHGIHLPQLSLRATVVQTQPLPQVFNGNACDNEVAFRRREDGGYSLAPTDEHGFFIGPDALRHAPKYRKALAGSWRELDLRLASPKGYPDGWRTPRHWDEDAESPFERTRVLEPVPAEKQVGLVTQRFADRFPELSRPKVRNAWAGMIDAMPDAVPVVDHAPGIEGVILATGMSGHGFGIGPGMGEVIAKMVLGQTPDHDMTRFRATRFTDGSPIVVGPGL